MPSTFGKDDELNRPDLGNYRLSLPYALYLKRSPAAAGSTPSIYQTDIVVLEQLESYGVDEDIAVHIRPTMDGGKYITHRGMILKDITVSGTTGYMPNGVNGTTTSQLAQAAADPSFSSISALVPNSPENLSQAEQNRQQNSGFIKFVQLRNLIREYTRIKRFETPEIANSTYLFFYDRKLDEWWTVEPLKFRMFRSNKKPFLYDYTIPLKTIAPGSDTGADPFSQDLPGDKQIGTTAGIVLGISGAVQEALAVVNRLVGISRAINLYAGQFTGVIRDAFNAVLEPLDAITAIFGNLASAKETLESLPSSLSGRLNNSLDGLLSQVTRLSTDTQLISATNDVYIETRMLSESLFARAPELFAGQSSTQSPQAVLSKENDKYTTPRMLNGTAGSAINDPQGTTTSPTTSFVNGSGLNLLTSIDFTRFTDVKQAIVMKGETVETLALRTTGTPFTAPMIKKLNRLQFPYLIGQNDNYSPGTLKPGDPILVPAIPQSAQNQPTTQTPLPEPKAIAASGGITTAVTGNVVTDATATWRPHQWAGFTFSVTLGTGLGTQVIILDNDVDTLTLSDVVTVDLSSEYMISLIQQQKNRPMTPLEVRYGIDLLLVFPLNQLNQPVQVADAVLGPTGDLVVVGGLPNFVQAMTILAYTEQGRNLANPLYGIVQGIGGKNTQERAIAFAFSLRAGILADPRTQNLNRIQFGLSKDTNSAVASVTPIGGTQQILALPSPV